MSTCPHYKCVCKTHFESSPQHGEPSRSALSPWDVWHLAGVKVGIDAGLAAGHVAIDFHGVINHAKIGIDPVHACREIV